MANKHDKFKAYWESIRKPQLEVSVGGLPWRTVARVEWYPWADYRIKDDPHWELRLAWVNSDFTLPIEQRWVGREWHLVTRPCWERLVEFRAKPGSITDDHLEEAIQRLDEPEPNNADWIPHTPGEPMPCEHDVIIDVRFRDGSTDSGFDASWWWWGITEEGWADIVAWRPAQQEPNKEYTGSSVSYYKVRIDKPTNPDLEPYTAECNDIIEALGMNYAEGNAFKAVWRSCAARNLGLSKDGYKDGLYDAEKVVFFGQRMIEQAKEAK